MNLYLVFLAIIIVFILGWFCLLRADEDIKDNIEKIIMKEKYKNKK